MYKNYFRLMKKIYSRSFFIALALFSCTGHCFSQNIDSLVTLHRQADPQEKIYIQFDKSYYNPGETIWFKAYLFTGFEPSVASRNFYAELVDENGTVLNRLTAPIAESSTAGSFDIASGFSKNLVYFRAYTAAMMNGDTSFLYVKPIHIIVPPKGPKNKEATVSAIRFLPEGGDWFAGLSSEMAFKITDQDGLPVNASGYIQSGNGARVLNFATVHDGMGSFSLQPVAGETYTAVWKDANNKSYTTVLPVVKPAGISLHVTDGDGEKRFIIQRSGEVPEADREIKVMAFINQHLVYSARANLTESTGISGRIPTRQFPSGIMQVTLFNSNYKPLAERVCFINNHDYEFDADAWVPVLNTGKRGLNKGEILLNDSLRANLSIAVTDADMNEPPPNADNIVSHLLLTGDLRGKIANPYYYFFSTSDSAAMYLDLVMLTNGWRRYNWDDLLAGKMPVPRFKESNYLALNGQLVGMAPGRIPPGTELTGILQTKDSSNSFLSLPVDRNGKVSTDGLIFYDYAKLYFQFRDKKQTFDKSMLQVDNGLLKQYGKVAMGEAYQNPYQKIDTVVLANNLKNTVNQSRVAVERKRKEQVLKEVIVKAKAKSNLEKMDEKYASGLFSGGDARTFDVANDPFANSGFTVFQYLQGKVAGLQINTSNPGSPSLSWRGSSPVLYLDEMPADGQLLSSINMSDVAYIKVFSPGATGGISNSGGGAIAVYTKKGGDVTSKGKGLDFIQVTGYAPFRQFYSPDYATPSSLEGLDDLRTTLYWNPYILLNKGNRRFKFQFYNSDITRRFRSLWKA
jgi:hypothetical protein